MERVLSKVKVWAPSCWGLLVTWSSTWQMRSINGRLELRVGEGGKWANVGASYPVELRHGLIWSDLKYPDGLLRGLPKALAKELQVAIDLQLAAEKEHARLVAEQRRQVREERFTSAYGLIHGWLSQIGAELTQAKNHRHWFTHEQQVALLKRKPTLAVNDCDLDALLKDTDIQQGMEISSSKVDQVLKGWRADWPLLWKGVNRAHTEDELVACSDLFGKVEKRRLNDEQARAVICFDNRVQVVASAGSGKTSTMVAKAAYAIDRGIVAPTEIVMLAFNKEAARELAERAKQSFERLEMNVTVRAKTFHGLGLAIIGHATKRKPRVPKWATDTQGGIQKLGEIVDQLKDSSIEFRARWDLFRLVFGRDIPMAKAMRMASKTVSEDDTLRTLKGEPVESLEECMIANWLFYNGVNYQYERSYEHDTATAEHGQYHPDFYYPDIGLYHEHFAFDEHGKPPPHFEGYLESSIWKRELHAEHGTVLIETTSSQLYQNTWIEHLTNELTSRGIVLDPNPDRPFPQDGQMPMPHHQLLQLIRIFIGHAKSNCLTPEDLYARVELLSRDVFKHRFRMFLDILWPVMRGWNAALKEADGIDFEDMLNMAAEYVEQGRCVPRYRLVMADEFQDASRARARLCRALVQQPGRHFFAVGDDWQSINRFAGADVSVMTDFVQWFGSGEVLKLEETFRCPQALCDVSSQFISKNPVQIAKTVRSKTPLVGPVLRAFLVKSKQDIQAAIFEYLCRLVDDLMAGRIPAEPGRKLKIYVLGRYNRDEEYIPTEWKAKFGQFLDVSFLSVHRSKGAEADYVILPAMVSVRRGYSFPSTMADDPIVTLAMAGGDDYPFGEERRLFYVALTRARRSVAMFTVQGRTSVFLKELVKDGAVKIEDPYADGTVKNQCPKCLLGRIIERNGPYGPFLTCDNRRECNYKPPKKRGLKRKKA